MHAKQAKRGSMQRAIAISTIFVLYLVFLGYSTLRQYYISFGLRDLVDSSDHFFLLANFIVVLLSDTSIVLLVVMSLLCFWASQAGFYFQILGRKLHVRNVSLTLVTIPIALTVMLSYQVARELAARDASQNTTTLPQLLCFEHENDDTNRLIHSVLERGQLMQLAMTPEFLVLFKPSTIQGQNPRVVTYYVDAEGILYMATGDPRFERRFFWDSGGCIR